MAQQTSGTNWKSEIKKELEHLAKAQVGNPDTPFAKTPELSPEFSTLMNESVGLCHSVANASDSAAAFFGRDNVGLPGISQYFKVCAVAHRADSWLAIDFLNAHGVKVTFPDIVPPPDSTEWHTQEMSDVLYAFTKALASAKVCMALTNKLYAHAHKHHDADGVAFAAKKACQDAEDIRVLSHYVAHLKVAHADKHAIKDFDRELKVEVQDKAKAAAIEAVIPPRLQLGVMARVLKSQAFEIQGGGLGDEPSRQRAVYYRAAQ